ncbi:hypothetical protein ACSBM8_02825 [Sphingomonas sp. ASY06-1R]|jgi:hypothetical protein|uniref:hypothetical protein n=1 Tax=Sphingomonas sp. ASY06-1R TaxID=3445771 RepID=UPI003FA224A6
MAEGLLLLSAMALSAITAFILSAVVSCTRLRDGLPYRFLWTFVVGSLLLYGVTFPWGGAYPLANGLRAAAMILLPAGIGAVLGRAVGALLRRSAERI